MIIKLIKHINGELREFNAIKGKHIETSYYSIHHIELEYYFLHEKISNFTITRDYSGNILGKFHTIIYKAENFKNFGYYVDTPAMRILLGDKNGNN